MTKDVLISISGLQMADEDGSEPVEVITSGEYYFRNGKHYLIYDEVMEGFQGVTKNRIRFYPNGMDIQKHGISNVHMIFEKNKKNMALYETPFGSIMLGIHADRVSVEESEEKIDIKVDYSLDINEELLADCKISICVRPKEEGAVCLTGRNNQKN